MEIEKQRGISVACSVMQMEYRDCVINLLDTPGHQDFSEDTYRVLTAVDAALMVIDAANGVEPQTRRLLQVCRARNTPILTFVNKMDREVREPLDLMDEIERELGMAVRALHLAGRHGQDLPRRDGPAHAADARVRARRRPPAAGRRDRRRPGQPGARRSASAPTTSRPRQRSNWSPAPRPPFDRGAFLAGHQTPMFFGSASTTSACARCSTRWSTWRRRRPAPARVNARGSAARRRKFTGVVFKIQANMDPAHRDRIAFVRVASGHFERGMRLKVVRSGKELRPNTVVTFLSQRRDCSTRPLPATSSASRTTACCSSATR